MKLNEFILAASKQTEIHVAEDIKPLVIELKRIGSNINQIAMKINSGAVYAVDVSEVVEIQGLIYEELYRIAGDR